MAKVSFTKLGLKLNQDINVIDFNGQTIEVKQYLPLENKLTMMGDIINNSVDDNGYYNPVRLHVYTILYLMETYTNINFTPKMKEDPFKLFDLLESSGLAEQVLQAMNQKELTSIKEDVLSTINNIYNYKNSMAGVIEMVTSDYENLNLDATNVQKALGDPNNLTLLKDVMTKLG